MRPKELPADIRVSKCLCYDDLLDCVFLFSECGKLCQVPISATSSDVPQIWDPLSVDFNDNKCSMEAVDIYMHADLDSIVVSLRLGDIVTFPLDMESSSDVVGSFPDGITSSSWSPDGEFLVVVTGSGCVSLLTLNWDLVVEHPSDETCTNASVRWRSDSKSVFVAKFNDTNCISAVFLDRSGDIKSALPESERAALIPDSVAWRAEDNGFLFALLRESESKTSLNSTIIARIENNGLLYDKASVPLAPASSSMGQLWDIGRGWSGPVALISTTCNRLTLCVDSNRSWRVLQTIPLERSAELVGARFLESSAEHCKILLCLFDGTCILIEGIWDMQSFAGAADGCLSQISDLTLQVTDSRRGVLPPPLSHCALGSGEESIAAGEGEGEGEVVGSSLSSVLPKFWQCSTLISPTLAVAVSEDRSLWLLRSGKGSRPSFLRLGGWPNKGKKEEEEGGAAFLPPSDSALGWVRECFWHGEQEGRAVVYAVDTTGAWPEWRLSFSSPFSSFSSSFSSSSAAAEEESSLLHPVVESSFLHQLPESAKHWRLAHWCVEWRQLFLVTSNGGIWRYPWPSQSVTGSKNLVPRGAMIPAPPVAVGTVFACQSLVSATQGVCLVGSKSQIFSFSCTESDIAASVAWVPCPLDLGVASARGESLPTSHYASMMASVVEGSEGFLFATRSDGSLLVWLWRCQSPTPLVLLSCRQTWEDGAKLIAFTAKPLRILLQVARGNLEVVVPRSLALHIMHHALATRSYGEAHQLARTYRLPMRSLFDASPLYFMRHAEELVRATGSEDSAIQLASSASILLNETKEEFEHRLVFYADLYAHSDQDKILVLNASRWLPESVARGAQACGWLRAAVVAWILRRPASLSRSLAMAHVEIGTSTSKARALLDAVRVVLKHDDALFSAAVEVHDIKLIRLACGVTHKDPRAYGPMLSQWETAPPLTRAAAAAAFNQHVEAACFWCAQAFIQAEDIVAADPLPFGGNKIKVLSSSAGDEYTDAAIERLRLMARSNLDESWTCAIMGALQSFGDSSSLSSLQSIYGAWAHATLDSLKTSAFRDAGIALACSGDYEGAARAFAQGGERSLCVSALSIAGLSCDSASAIVQDIGNICAASCERAGNFIEAGRTIMDFGGLASRAAQLFTSGGNFVEAARFYSKGHDYILPSSLGSLSASSGAIGRLAALSAAQREAERVMKECRKSSRTFEKCRKELELLCEKAKSFAVMHSMIDSARDPQQVRAEEEAYSDTWSARSGTHYSFSSAASTARSSRKMERQKLKGRKGSPHEVAGILRKLSEHLPLTHFGATLLELQDMLVFLGDPLTAWRVALSFSSFVGATCKWEEVCLKSLGSVEAMDNFGIGVSDAWRALEQKQSQIVTIPRFYMRNEYSLPAKEGMLFSSLLQEDTEWNEWVQQNQEDTKGAAESTMNDDDEDNEEEMSLGMDSIFA